jgi:hypothetical protein
MARYRIPVVSVAAAIAALLPHSGESAAISRSDAEQTKRQDATHGGDHSADASGVNVTIDAGGDFLGFVVSKSADGVTTAFHSSHQSHSSHSSHRSHFSSR